MIKRTIFIISVITAAVAIMINSCHTSQIGVQHFSIDTIYTAQDDEGYPVAFHFEKGSKHNYPLMALWITDTNNNYLQTLYVAESIAKGIFKHGETSTGKWQVWFCHGSCFKGRITSETEVDLSPAHF